MGSRRVVMRRMRSVIKEKRPRRYHSVNGAVSPGNWIPLCQPAQSVCAAGGASGDAKLLGPFPLCSRRTPLSVAQGLFWYLFAVVRCVQWLTIAQLWLRTSEVENSGTNAGVCRCRRDLVAVVSGFRVDLFSTELFSVPLTRPESSRNQHRDF